MKINIYIISFFLFSYISHAKNNRNIIRTETCTNSHYDGLYSTLPQKIILKIAPQKMSNTSYTTVYAKNNGSISLKKNKNSTFNSILPTTSFDNIYATNSSDLEAVNSKNTTYELLSNNTKKESFSEVAFFDINTLVTVSFTKKKATLLLIDISNNNMIVTSAINIPVDNPINSKINITDRKELFYIDTTTQSIFIPVNNSNASVSKKGELGWKKSNKITPGIWIIKPAKNDEKKWTIIPSQISINYFNSENLVSKGKHALKLQTIHPDINGNVWMSFTNGILGVLPVENSNHSIYAKQLNLFNFNMNFSWFSDMKKNYSTLLYNGLKGTMDTESMDTSTLKKRFFDNPEAFGIPYLENARYKLYSNILSEKNKQLDSNAAYDNNENLWQFVNLELDNPLAKKKNKTINYFGYKIKQFQTIHNSITSDNDGAVYIVTNLGLHKLSYNKNKDVIIEKWSLPYKNSFLKEFGNKTATSLTTPTFIEERDEIIFCDNDFPQINLIIVNSKTGSVKQKFPLFEYNSGSACSNAIAYNNHTIIIGNTFGNGKNSYMAKGIMRFYSSEKSNWKADYDWNKLQITTLCNTASPKITSADQKVLIYHQSAEPDIWQLSAIKLNKIDKFNPILYSLKPQFSIIKNKKINLNNNFSNFSIGPKKSLFIGTSDGLLKIISE